MQMKHVFVIVPVNSDNLFIESVLGVFSDWDKADAYAEAEYARRVKCGDIELDPDPDYNNYEAHFEILETELDPTSEEDDTNG